MIGTTKTDDAPKVASEYEVLQVTDDYVALDAGEGRVIHATRKEGTDLTIHKGDTVRVSHTKLDKSDVPTDAVITSVKQ